MTDSSSAEPWPSGLPVLELPMFPLGSVLFPHMPLALRLFEERYLTMLAHLLEAEDPAFGVVLIERGRETGGGEHRFRTGTVAEIDHAAPSQTGRLRSVVACSHLCDR